MAELLFWPALIAYGEAAVAYVGVLRRPELATRLAIWGVRIGWLAQTCLLAVEAWQADGFPWADWAGALNLFVWFAVGAYLVYGSSPRYRLLGIAVMPAAAALFALAGIGGAGGAEQLRPVHRASRRARRRRLCGLRARGRARRVLPLARAAAEAPAGGRAPARPAVARHARRRRRAGVGGLARRVHGRDRDRPRARTLASTSRSPARSRPGSSSAPRSCFGASSAGAASARPT